MVVSEFRCFICICLRKQSRPVDVWQINVSFPSLSCTWSHNEHIYFVFRLHTLQYPCFNCVVVFLCALVSFLWGLGVFQDLNEPNHHIQANPHLSQNHPLAIPWMAEYSVQISDHAYCRLAPPTDASRTLVALILCTWHENMPSMYQQNRWRG